MSTFKKTYFLPPTFELTLLPPEGSLFLGSIICSVSRPELSLNKSNYVPVANLDPPVVETDCLYTITEHRKPRSRGHDEFLRFLKERLACILNIPAEQILYLSLAW